MDKESMQKQLVEKKAYLEQVRMEMYAVGGQIQLLEEMLTKEAGKKKPDGE